MKKILFVITKSVWGGAQKYVHDLATHLPTDRFEVVVAAGGSGPLFERLKNQGIRTIPIPYLEREIRPGKDLRTLGALLRIFSQEQPDIIHLNSPKVGGLGGLAAFLYHARAKHRVRVVYTVHGWPFREDRWWGARLAIFLAAYLSSWFHDAVILVNTSDRALAQRFLPTEKLFLVQNGLGPIPFLAREVARREVQNLLPSGVDPHTRWIGTVAELTLNKGLTYLIQAVRRIRFQNGRLGFQVFVVGEGEDRSRLERHIQQLGLGERVFLTGFLPDAERYLTAFDLFVLPSVKEGLPYAILQAMAAELAIVATTVGGIPDLVEPGRSGILVPAKQPVRLASALEKLLADASGRQRLGRNARQRLETHFGLPTMINKTCSVYQHDAR